MYPSHLKTHAHILSLIFRLTRTHPHPATQTHARARARAHIHNDHYTHTHNPKRTRTPNLKITKNAPKCFFFVFQNSFDHMSRCLAVSPSRESVGITCILCFSLRLSLSLSLLCFAHFKYLNSLITGKSSFWEGLLRSFSFFCLFVCLF